MTTSSVKVKDSREHTTLYTLIIVMVVIALSVVGITLLILYETAFQEAENRLMETARSHARLIKSISNFNTTYGSGFTGSAEAALLLQIKEGFVTMSGTSELVIGQRRGDKIFFIARQRATTAHNNFSVPFDASLAEPMRLALMGKSGTTIGLDYRNQLVLAAHEPVDVLGLGIVAKMDIKEIREPFILAGITTGGFALVIIFFGIFIFIRVSNPILQAIADSEKRYRFLVEEQTDLICRNRLDTTLLMVNDAYCRFFDKSKAELTGSKFIELVPEAFKQHVLKNLAQLSPDHPTGTQEQMQINSHGEERWIQWTNTATFDAQGYPIEFVAIGHDITNKRQLENALIQSQKMEAVGQLTGGIAHDFNNILGVIMGNLELLRRKCKKMPETKKFVDAAYAGSERGAKITKKLLHFSRHAPVEQKRMNVNTLITDMKALIITSLTPKIIVETHLSAEVWMTKVNPGDFEDALLNFALNAGDAMVEGGTLVIETKNKSLDAAYVKNNPGSFVGDFILITISDSGIGMSQDVAEQVFQPFFTTKTIGQGTGLGMSMVYGFVQRSNGHIKIYSEPGRGTTIHLYLPRDKSKLQDPNRAQSASLSEQPKGDETILIVDDEQALVDIAAAYLEDLGYTTLTANTAKQALVLLKTKSQIQLVFTDVVMPGEMDGYDLAKATLKQYPDKKVLLTSGFTSKREGALNGDVALFKTLSKDLLNKPYIQNELAIAVRKTLDGDHQS